MKDLRFYIITTLLALIAGGVIFYTASESKPPEAGETIDSLTKSRGFRSVEDCQFFTEIEGRLNCLFLVRVDEIVADGDISLCETSYSGTDISKCIWRVADQMGKSGQTTTICEGLSLPLYQTTCREKITLAARYFDKSQEKLAFIDEHALDFKQKSNEIIQGETESKVIEWEEVQVHDNSLEIKSFVHTQRNEGEKPFSQVNAKDYGISEYNRFSVLDFTDPFLHGDGIAAGDYNNDAWQDLVIASNGGVVLYKNMGGKFAKVPTDFPELQGKSVFVVAFIDLNNDTWLDLFATTYGGENYFFFNKEGSFVNADVMRFFDEEVMLTNAASFADTNYDGLIDFVVGNWAAAKHQAGRWGEAKNRTYIQREEGGFDKILMDEVSMQTHSTLFTDFSGDGFMDLIVGNDFEAPDVFVLGSEQGLERTLRYSENAISQTPYYTMSYDTADVNNDLILDIFSGDLGMLETYFVETTIGVYCDHIIDDQEKVLCENRLDAHDIFHAQDMEACLELDDETKQECLLAVLISLADDIDDETLCQKIDDRYVSEKAFCLDGVVKGISGNVVPSPESIPQQARNSLMIGIGEGNFEEKGQEFGVSESRWSWNAKFADLDNDSWQDLYVGNGYHFHLRELDTNVFFHNQGGNGFEEKQAEFGLEDFLHTPSYVYIDIENDGDLDIIATGVNAPPRVFLNNATNKGISYSLSNSKGNTSGIGAKLIISTDSGSQVREIKAGGGFLSFDPYIVHFGLGTEESVHSLEIFWPDGSKTKLEQKFESGKHYQIQR